MNSQQGIKAKFKSRQQGAVAIIVAICIAVLIGILGLVLDLGHLYVTKTELQNAADAAALSGARELNGSMTGINNAINRAIEAGGKNKYDLNSKVVNITSANLSAGSCPSDSCMVPIGSVTAANVADKTFLKVDTDSRFLNTWFIRVLSAGSATTKTSGIAVAGKYATDITPLAACSLPHDPTDPTMAVSDFGYKRGVTYQLSNSNPIGPGTAYWIDPVTVTDTPVVKPATCTGDTPSSLPYVCAGKVDFTPLVNQYVYTNTGVTNPQLEALDSRFNIYTSSSKCSPLTAPPDSNIKSYKFDGPSGGQPRDWMTNVPTQQSIKYGYYKCNATTCSDQCIKGNGTKTCSKNNSDAQWRPIPYSLQSSANDYGVLWSASRPVGKASSDWSTLYKGQTAKSYPEPSPYAQGSGSPFYQTPAVNAGQPRRRLMNMVIVQCSAAGGECNSAKVLGIGRFFLQREATVPSSDKNIYLEFAGMLPTPLPTSDIRLYR